MMTFQWQGSEGEGGDQGRRPDSIVNCLLFILPEVARDSCLVQLCSHIACVTVLPIRWDWLAISLNPYYEGNDQFAMIDDDVLIGQTLDHW